MELVEGKPGWIRVYPHEQILEAIKLIKPDNIDKSCRFFSGYLSQVQEPAYDGDKMLYRTYELVKRHVYTIQENHQPNLKYKVTYIKVTSVGNIVEISREEACAILDKRESYVLDVDIRNPPEFETEEAPVPVCDW